MLLRTETFESRALMKIKLSLMKKRLCCILGILLFYIENLFRDKKCLATKTKQNVSYVRILSFIFGRSL